MLNDDPEFQPHWLVVVELDDVVPRRDPKKPNLFLEVSSVVPSKRFDQICQSKRKHWYSGHVQKLWRELSNTHRFPNHESAIAGMKLQRDKLLDDGYTVNRNTRVWHVYVLELDASNIEDPGSGYVYVGETAHTPETRMQQHRGELLSKKGKSLSARSINVPIIGLRRDLAPSQIYFSSTQAKAAEKECAETLRAKGYLVEGGH